MSEHDPQLVEWLNWLERSFQEVTSPVWEMARCHQRDNRGSAMAFVWAIKVRDRIRQIRQLLGLPCECFACGKTMNECEYEQDGYCAACAKVEA